MNKIASIVGLAVAATAMTASADVAEFVFDINDFGLSVSNVIGGSGVDGSFDLGAIDSIDSISIELSHSWSGDIDFFISDGTSILFDLTFAQGGSSDLGDGGSDGTGLGLYTFVASGSANGLLGVSTTAPGDYDANGWTAGPFASSAWFINLSDLASGDDGAVGSVFINYTVPAPGAMALLGLGGIVAGRRRR